MEGSSWIGQRFLHGVTKEIYAAHEDESLLPVASIDSRNSNNRHLVGTGTVNIPVPLSQVGVTVNARLGLSWLDASTGEMFVSTTTFDALREELGRICPAEVSDF